MRAFLESNLFPFILIGLGILFLFALWFGWRGRYRDKAKGILLALVVAAEEKFGAKTGPIKFSYVAERLYAVMPKVFQLFFTADTIGIWIEEAVGKMKEALTSGGDTA